MNERLLQFIWQFQYFNKQSLKSDEDEHIEIVHPGYFNTNQGPDFLEAKIRIDNTLLAGSVEVHVKASDWNVHKHSTDARYNNVVLHVVWDNDMAIGSNFSTLTLQPLVAKILLNKYRQLMQQKPFVFCENHLPFLSPVAWQQWKERLAIERLLRKSNEILLLLQQNNNHWEETFWQLLAKNFGIKVNADIFYAVAKSISINILAKHKNQIHQLEALLFGVANLLPSATNDEYAKILIREYKVLSNKYRLKQLPNSPLFLRMRPANFPSIRLAQLAMLIHQSNHLFSKIKETDSIQNVQNMFSVIANDYWHYRYKLADDPGDFQPKKLGNAMIENIMINTVIPTIFSYGHYHRLQVYKDKALDWLQQVNAEKNVIIAGWKNFEITACNAMESQGLIELKNNYCNERLCLECNVGKAVLSGK